MASDTVASLTKKLGWPQPDITDQTTYQQLNDTGTVVGHLEIMTSNSAIVVTKAGGCFEGQPCIECLMGCSDYLSLVTTLFAQASEVGL